MGARYSTLRLGNRKAGARQEVVRAGTRKATTARLLVLIVMANLARVCRRPTRHHAQIPAPSGMPIRCSLKTLFTY